MLAGLNTVAQTHAQICSNKLQLCPVCMQCGLEMHNINNDNITSCCSSDRERTHCCCHLPNKVENIDCKLNIPYTLPPKLPLLWGDLGLHPIHGSVHPSESKSQTAPRSVQHTHTQPCYKKCKCITWTPPKEMKNSK